jgi:hypothetical protein
MSWGTSRTGRQRGPFSESVLVNGQCELMIVLPRPALLSDYGLDHLSPSFTRL